MSDLVKTELEALILAETFLAKHETLRKNHFENWSRETGRSISFIPYVFILMDVETYVSGWAIKYEVENVDPGVWVLTVNRVTGEVKFDVF